MGCIMRARTRVGSDVGSDSNSNSGSNSRTDPNDIKRRNQRKLKNLMYAMDWTTIAAIGQFVAAMAAVIGLFFVGLQIKAARMTADLQALQEFFRAAADHEARLGNTDGDEKNLQAFNEFLNFLEVSATAYNHELFQKTTKKIVYEKLRDSIVVLKENPQWHRRIEQAITSDSALEELRIFMERNRTDIERVVEARKQLMAQT